MLACDRMKCFESELKILILSGKTIIWLKMMEHKGASFFEDLFDT